MIELKEILPVGVDMTITCPHCGRELKINVPKEGKGTLTCQKCGGKIGITAKSKTVIFSVPTDPAHLTHFNPNARRGRLVKVNGFFSKNEIYKLRDGKNVIGRFDPSQQSDIAISGDGLMSRRSVEIEAIPQGGAYLYKFTILKSTNPVIYNKKPCGMPFSREIRFGDTFVLGNTTFRFEEDK